MATFRATTAACSTAVVLAAASLAAQAQTAPAASAAPGGQGAPSAGAAGATPMGNARDPGRHGRWGDDYTPGWAWMSPAEREAHQAQMLAMKTRDECRAYLDRHHAQMVERARKQGRAMPHRPQRDGCADLPR